MATKRQAMPRHAEAARLECVAVLLEMKDVISGLSSATLSNDRLAAMAAVAELQRLAGAAHVILLQQGQGTFGLE